MVDQRLSRDSGNGDRRGVAHHPQSQIENMHADVNTGSAAGVLLLDETGRRNQARAAQHPAARMVHVAERAFVYLGFERFGGA